MVVINVRFYKNRTHPTAAISEHVSSASKFLLKNMYILHVRAVKAQIQYKYEYMYSIHVN